MISAVAIAAPTIPALAEACAPNDASCSPSIASLESQLLDLVNRERTGAGLSALSVNPWAASIAHAWSEKMRADADISHDDAYFAQGRSNMPGARLLGENVAMGGSVQRIHDLFMESPTHRENVMEPRFTHVGIGFARDDNGYLFATQDFAEIPPPAPATTAQTGPSTVRVARPPAARAQPAATRTRLPRVRVAAAGNPSVESATPPPSASPTPALAVAVPQPHLQRGTPASGSMGSTTAALAMLVIFVASSPVRLAVRYLFNLG